jgi:hypothetical protein
MQQENKNQKISRIAAKTAIRVFIIILFFGLLPLISGQGQPWDQRLANAHLVVTNKWMLAFPALLFAGFLTLTILCLKNKYRLTDINWLLVLNAIILVAYLVMLYSRIYKVLLAV